MSDSSSRWDAVATLVTGRRSWAVALAVLVASILLTVGVGSNDSAGQSPTSLPESSESAVVQQVLADFPDSDVASAILVVSRPGGDVLTDSDIAAAGDARARMLAVDRKVAVSRDASGGPDVVTAPDGRAAIAPVLVSTELSGLDLTDLVTELRTAASQNLPAI